MYGVPTGGLLKSDFEMSYVSDSVVLELSAVDFCSGIALRGVHF